MEAPNAIEPARPRRQVRAPQARLYLNGSTITPMMRTG